MRSPSRLNYQILAVFLALTAALLTLNLASAASRSGLFSNTSEKLQVVSPTPSPSPTPQLTQRRFLPLLMSSKPADVELLDAWTSNSAGGAQQAFLPGDAMQFRSSGLVNLDKSLQAHLRWIESGPCSSGEIFSGTVTMKAGNWEHSLNGVAPDCAGIYSSTVQLKYGSLIYQQSIKYVVNDQDSTIQFSDGHGFDRCYLPDLDMMQSWMDSSPYSVFNLYIGGISFACKTDPVDAVWVYNTSLQGWAFILTWVGPQAPCTDFTHRMSSDPSRSYLQGLQEADAANAAAISLGFQGNKVIYYDLEGYSSADNKCRDAVHAFMRGWTERLQELGAGAGGYGGACSSFVSEWADIQPPPDDVWIAHWYKDKYDPTASVWKAPCVSDDLWPDFQRTKQYAGGHKETWGGDSLTIDSNKFEGKTVVIPKPALENITASSSVEVSGPELKLVGLVSSGEGWVVSDEHLYWTVDGGSQWQDITPLQLNGGRILGAAFSDESRGWVVAQMTSADMPKIAVMRTEDGGTLWDSTELAGLTVEESQAADSAYLSVVDASTAWVLVKLQSGSSFSLGRLFATRDGGATWEARNAPAGDPVSFIDANTGWMVAGPAQDSLYRTQDGGQTWQKQTVAVSNGEQAILGIPWFDTDGTAWLPVVNRTGAQEKLVYYASRNRGDTWSVVPGLLSEPLGAREALLEMNTSLLETVPSTLSAQVSLPEGAYQVDFTGRGEGWAVSRSGTCEVAPTSGTKRCAMQNLLLSTTDGGVTWEPVCSPELPCFKSVALDGAGE